MKLSPLETGLLLDALNSHIEALESFLSDAEEGDDVESVRGDLVAARELEAKAKATLADA